MPSKLSKRLIKQIQSFLATWYGEQADGFVIEENFKEVAEELYWKAIHEELCQALEEWGKEIIGPDGYGECDVCTRNDLRAEQRDRLAQKLEDSDLEQEIKKARKDYKEGRVVLEKELWKKVNI